MMNIISDLVVWFFFKPDPADREEERRGLCAFFDFCRSDRRLRY